MQIHWSKSIELMIFLIIDNRFAIVGQIQINIFILDNESFNNYSDNQKSKKKFFILLCSHYRKPTEMESIQLIIVCILIFEINFENFPDLSYSL